MTTSDLDPKVKPSKKELRDCLDICVGVAEVVREAGAQGIPEGELYAVLLGKLDIAGWNAIMRTLKGAQLIEVRGHVLYWVGPHLN